MIILSKEIINRKLNLSQSVDFHRLKLEDLDKIINLEEEVVSMLKDKSYFYSSGKNYYEKILNGLGVIIGVKTSKQKLLAFSALITQDKEEISETMISDISIIDQWKKYCLLDSVVVSADYRGNGLQKLLILQLIKIAKENFNKTYMLCTVHPSNLYSYNNFNSLGFVFLSAQNKYGGLPRHTLVKEL